MLTPPSDSRALQCLHRLPAQKPDTDCRDHAFALAWREISKSFLQFWSAILLGGASGHLRKSGHVCRACGIFRTCNTVKYNDGDQGGHGDYAISVCRSKAKSGGTRSSWALVAVEKHCTTANTLEHTTSPPNRNFTILVIAAKRRQVLLESCVQVVGCFPLHTKIAIRITESDIQSNQFPILVAICHWTGCPPPNMIRSTRCDVIAIFGSYIASSVTSVQYQAIYRRIMRTTCELVAAQNHRQLPISINRLYLP